MGLANIESGLDDDQVQSLVHQLRHEYSSTHPEDNDVIGRIIAEETWVTTRQNMETQIQAHPMLRPQRRAGMLQRIRGAAMTPPPDMVYAAAQIRSRCMRVARLMEDQLAVEAARAGVPDAVAAAAYEGGRADAPRGRQSRASAEQRTRWPNLPMDPRTRHGLAALAALPDSPDGRQDLISAHPAPTAASVDVAGVGYHADSQRLEVITPHGTLLAYRSVPAEVARRLAQGTAPDPDAAFRELLGNPAHQYRDATQAAAAGTRRRCPECGQFTGATHTCLGQRERDLGQSPSTPGTPGPTTEVELGPEVGSVSTYGLDHIAGDLEQQRGTAVMFPVVGAAGGPSDLRGSLIAQLDGTDEISTTGRFLWCSCPAYTPEEGCSHTVAAAAAMRQQLIHTLQRQRQMAAEQTAAAIAQSHTESTTLNAPDAVVDAPASPTVGGAVVQPAVDALIPEAPNRCTFSYATDPARFADVLRRVAEQPSTQQVPWMDSTDQPVLYGFGADRDFGVEIEFDADHDRLRERMPIDDRTHQSFAPGETSTLINRVGLAMHEAGMTTSASRRGYHSAARGGYSRTARGGWTYESDCTVQGGELVSPILSNTHEAWDSLRQTCEIVTNHGGRASAATGSHITVSAPDQAGQAVRLTRLLRFLHHHQSDLFVMAAAGHNRGRRFAGLLREPPPEGYQRIQSAVSAIDRYSLINIAHVGRTSAMGGPSRVEYRLWDGSIDPGRIQAQIRMSTALQDYAARDRALAFTAAGRGDSGPISPDHDDFAVRTTQIRTLLDTLFRRDQDKTQAAALWASGLQHRGFHR